MANTPIRSFRIPDDIYLPAKEHSEADGVSLTAIVVSALWDFVDHRYRDENDIN